MHKMTEQHLINAFGGESQAHMRYLHFAKQAEKENFPNVALLWKAIAHAEFIHAGDHYQQLQHLAGGLAAHSMATFGPGNTEKNLILSIAGESFEIEEIYPSYIEIAKLQKEPEAQRSFEWSYETEKIHKELFEKALDCVQHQQDLPVKKVQICEICGYTWEGNSLEICPLCNASKEKFKIFKS